MTKEREALQMCLEYIEKNAHERRHVRWAIKEALAQPEQEPLAGKGKELSEQLKHCARNVAFVAAGWVDMSSAAMQEMFALIDHVCVGIDSPPLPEQELVAWMLTDKNINSLQVDSIQRLIDRLKHAHHTDLCVRINGQDEWFQADWLKHMVRVTPPQRPWVGLTGDEISSCDPYEEVWDLFKIARKLEAKLKEKNNG